MDRAFFPRLICVFTEIAMNPQSVNLNIYVCLYNFVFYYLQGYVIKLIIWILFTGFGFMMSKGYRWAYIFNLDCFVLIFKSIYTIIDILHQYIKEAPPAKD